MAPGNRRDLHAGHSVGALAGCGLVGTVIGGTGLEGATTAAGAVAAAATGVGFGTVPAAIGCGAATAKMFLQKGHRTCFPAAFSGICVAFLQCGQRITSGISMFLLLPFPETQHARPDTDHVARAKRSGPRKPEVVQERAARRPRVGELVTVSRLHDARVYALHALVAEQPDIAPLS